MAISYVMERLAALRSENAPYLADRWRTRQIMNGGAQGIAAVMAWNQGKESSGQLSGLGDDLPAVNMLASGIERLAQKVGQPPSLKMPYGQKDTEETRKAAEKLEYIVEGWDHMSRVDLQYRQIGRWLPGYAFYSQVITPQRNRVTGQLWPHLSLRDPFDSWPGYFGVDQQPAEIAYRRAVSVQVLKRVYPEYDWEDYLKKRSPSTMMSSPAIRDHVGGSESWDGPGGKIQVLEYYNDAGCYVCVPEFELILDYSPNICDTGPMFVVGKRISFDRMISAYHHVIGLMAQMAKLNMLSLIAAESSVFKETNIIGDLESGEYERGWGAVNFFSQGTTIDRPTGENNYQVWQQIDRIERQLRIGAAYDEGSDSLAARGGFITGRGQRELRDPVEANIDEYQTVIARTTEEADTRRLEWEDKHEASKKKKVFWIRGNVSAEETYVPKKDIAGNYHSQRVYGMMAGWDDSQKIVAGLQLLQARVIDPLTFQENLRGLDNTPQINQRASQWRAKEDVFLMLEARAQQGDPAAAMALVEIMDDPDNMTTVMKRLFTPAEPAPTPEEVAMMAGGGIPPGAVPPGAEAELGPGPTVQTILSELEASGVTGGGAQTVSVNRR